MSHVICLLLLAIFGNLSPAIGKEASFADKKKTLDSIARILHHIQDLSHPSHQGRQAGTRGGEQSARYVAKKFQDLNLVPTTHGRHPHSDNNIFQYDPRLTAIQILEPTTVQLFPLPSQASSTSSSLQIGRDYLPILDSPSVNLTAPLIFVGYGIDDPARGLDEYNNVDVNNRVVLFLRGKPPRYPQWVTLEEKVQTAQERGAAAYLTVTGPVLNPYQARKGLKQKPLAIYPSTPETRPIPGAWIRGKTFDDVLDSIHESLESWQQQANKVPGQVSRPVPLVAHLSWDILQKPGALINVLGLMLGNDPDLRNELILIGAHRDHFGEQAGLKFLGADDNASGTAVMLELARQLTERRIKPKRSLLFVSFDGEERGLLGSKHYVQNPLWPLEKTVAMINLDHVGVGNGKLTVGITQLDKSLAKQAEKRAGLAEKTNIYGYFPGGDHVPFYKAGVPTITIVSAGVHPHFHQSSDTAKTINPEILKTATLFTMHLIEILANPSSPVQ